MACHGEVSMRCTLQAPPGGSLEQLAGKQRKIGHLSWAKFFLHGSTAVLLQAVLTTDFYQDSNPYSELEEYLPEEILEH
jgi:hypothetical protein